MASILSSRIHSNDVVASHPVLPPLEEHLAPFPEHVRERIVYNDARTGCDGPILFILRAVTSLRQDQARIVEHHSMEIDILDFGGYYISGMQVYTPENSATHYLYS
jgi:hypothetical protein